MNRSDYETIIGLEIHSELNTSTKMFCACPNRFGDTPNTNCCPVCLGMPGALPIPNKRAVELTIMAGLTMGSIINDVAVFERKNYFYPDLSKSYQISQLVKPICLGGGITLNSGKTIRLNRIHLEEDAGKLVHGYDTTEVDYNRCGVPLIETVTEPDISSSEEAVEFLTKLREKLVFAGISKCKMAEGGMRVDINVSVKRKDSPVLGTRTEMKNLNSFRSVARAIEYEANRQIEELENGNIILQETRKWDDDKGVSIALRAKTDSQDYRYFPDPDLLPIRIKREAVERLKTKLPESRDARFNRYISKYNLPTNDAEILSSSKVISDFYDECVSILPEYKEIANWILVDILKLDFDEAVPISVDNLVEIIKMVLGKMITRQNGKELLVSVIKTGKNAKNLANAMGIISSVSRGEIERIVDELVDSDKKARADYATSPDKVMQYFIGGVMRLTGGRADGMIVREVLEKKLK